MDPLQGLQHRAVDIFMACKKGLLQEVLHLLDSGAIPPWFSSRFWDGAGRFKSQVPPLKWRDLSENVRTMLIGAEDAHPISS